MKIIYFGFVVDIKDAAQYDACSVAGNTMQYRLLEQLTAQSDIETVIVSAIPVSAFPKGRRLIARPRVDEISPRFRIHQVGYINFPVLKKLSVYISMLRLARRHIRASRGAEPPVLLSYNLYPPTGSVLLRLARRHNLRHYSLVADLPVDDTATMSLPAKIRCKAVYAATRRNLAKAQNVIVLNQNAAREYAPAARHMVMDGAYDPSLIRDGEYRPERKNIMYTGALSHYSGAMELIKAVQGLDIGGVALEIYGDGPLRGRVEEESRRDPRIKYMGTAPNDQIRELQSRAWLLANPRPVDDPIARVTFPSKTFEYMASGTPALTTRLNGIGPEYDGCLLFAPDGSPGALRQAIETFDAMPLGQKRQLADNARRLLREQKNWPRQGARILEFIRCQR